MAGLKFLCEKCGISFESGTAEGLASDAICPGCFSSNTLRPDTSHEGRSAPNIDQFMDELRDRFQAGEPIRIEAFLASHADLWNDRQSLLDVVYAEIVVREEFGEKPSLAEYQTRFPELAEDLRVQFEIEGLLDGGWNGTSQLASPGPAPDHGDVPAMIPIEENSGVRSAYRRLAALAKTRNEELPRVQENKGDLPRIAGYEILGVLGRGGMGVVYKARQQRLNRFVAVKMLLSGSHSGPGELERFRTEAEAVAKLQHPNIIQIYDVGSAEGHPYFSLEYVEGGSLAQKLQGNPLPPLEAARLSKTLAKAMQYAHEQGIIHRDLKPANVLMSGEVRMESPEKKDSKSSRRPGCHHSLTTPHSPLTTIPKIGDFGLAKHVDDSGQTATGSILGTPSYMAPEQASGRTREIGTTSDVYSLGAILYEMLTGRPPFRGATMVETLDQVRTIEPVSPRSLQPSVPADLETICLKCLEKDRAKRYASAQALADDLGRYLEGLPIVARPVGAMERSWKWAKRYPAIVALITVLLAATPLLIGLWIQARSATDDLAKANEDLGQQRDAIRRREANLTFDKALDLCNNGTIAEGLHWMVRSLEIDPAMSPAFEKLVRTNLASWGHHKIQLVRQLPHPNTVWSVSMSPKGDVFATACFDGGVRIWDCQSFALKAEFKEAIGCELRNLDFSPDGTKLAVALGLTRRTAEGTEQSKGALMWNLTTTPPKTILLDSTETILTVRFSHDGKTMATGGGVEKERTIRLWDATADVARLLNEVTLPRRREIAFTFSSDDKSLIIASHAGEIYRWNVDEPKVITLPQTHFAKTGVRWVEVSPDGKTMATCGDDFAVRFWDVESGEPKASPLMHRQILYSEKYTPDGRGIIVCSGASAVTLWDVFRGEKIEQLDLGAPAQVAVHPEGEFFVTGSMEGNVQVWRFPRCESVSRPHEVKQITRLNTGQWENTAAISANQQKIASRESSGQKALRLWDVSGDPLGPKLDFPIDVVSDVAFSPDGRYLAASGWRTDGTVRGHLAVWDIQEDPPKRRIFTHSNYVKTLAFHPNGRTLAAGDYHHFVRFWDLETGMEASEPIRETDIVLKIAYNGDGKTLAVGTARDRRGKPHLQFWNADTCERVGEPILHPASVTTLAFSPDFKSLFTGGIGNPVQLWDADSHQPLGKPLPMPDAFESLAFSSNGKTFALGNSNGVVQIYRSSDSEPQSKNFDHPHPPRALAFHPSGQQLLVGCGDGTIWLWDIETQRQLGPPVVHSQEIIRVAFLADGAGFLTVAGDGSVRRWRSPVPTPHDLPTLKRRVELLTSKSMAADGEINLIPSEAWEKLRKELIAHQGTDETSLAKPLSSREWHDARARDARQDNDAFAEQWHSVRRNRSK